MKKDNLKTETKPLQQPAISGSGTTDAEKALAILKAFHDLAHNSEKREGLTITKDWDIFTLSFFTKDGHVHLGQMNHEEDGFPILINEMYQHFCT